MGIFGRDPWVGKINWLISHVTNDFWYYHQRDDLTEETYIEILLRQTLFVRRSARSSWEIPGSSWSSSPSGPDYVAAPRTVEKSQIQLINDMIRSGC
jgi:hypothetical protein